ncbi:hypothetical protein KCU85_g4209, partial [Aureobasidium melanogenum]
MEKLKDLENQAAFPPPRQPKPLNAMMMRGVFLVEAICIVTYLYLRHDWDYFNTLLSSPCGTSLYCLYVLSVTALCIYYLPKCRNGDVLPYCAIKSGTFRSCRCPERVKATFWSQIRDEGLWVGAGVLMYEVLSRTSKYLQAQVDGLS